MICFSLHLSLPIPLIHIYVYTHRQMSWQMNRQTSTDWLLPKNKTTMCVRDIMLNKEPSTVYIHQVTHCSPCLHALAASHQRKPWANAVWSAPSSPPSGTTCCAPGHAASVRCALSRCIAHLVIAQKERWLKKRKCNDGNNGTIKYATSVDIQKRYSLMQNYMRAL